MSYIKADDILPKELLEAVQQYVDGKSIYIPSRKKQEWGSETYARVFFRERNERIYKAWKKGVSRKTLAQKYSLSEKSIQRILRDQQLAAAEEADLSKEDPNELNL